MSPIGITGMLFAHVSPNMRIAIPLWNNCVSSVFDFAHQLLVVDAEEQKEMRRSQIDLKDQSVQQRVADMAGLGIDVLICEAISRSSASILATHDLEVIPY